MGYIYIYILLICIIIFFAYYNSLHSQIQENFTPHIKRFYRPYLRHARLFTEGFYSHLNGHMNRFMRKTGLLK